MTSQPLGTGRALKLYSRPGTQGGDEEAEKLEKERKTAEKQRHFDDNEARMAKPPAESKMKML